MTAAKLDALVVRATVRIGPDDEPGTLWGSGFVAPGWVLTCRHILPPKDGPEGVGSLRVQGYDGLDVRARPDWLGGGTDPEQDLLLVRLTENAVHACVRLTDRYDPPLSVAAYGWRTPAGGAPQRWSGQTECNGKDGGYGLTLAPLVEIPHGASGGPLLDRERGLVAGVVKARRAQKDGGLAVAATALRGFRRAVPVGDENGLGADPYAALIRAHDTWHRKAVGAASWVKAQAGAGTGGERGWGPRDSADASALLAGLPEPRSPGELQALIQRVLGDEPLWEEEVARATGGTDTAGCTTIRRAPTSWRCTICGSSPRCAGPGHRMPPPSWNSGSSSAPRNCPAICGPSSWAWWPARPRRGAAPARTAVRTSERGTTC